MKTGRRHEAPPPGPTPPRTRQDWIRWLVEEVKSGRPVVPLLGAGISIDAGIPPLSEITAYLARTKAYIRKGVYTALRNHQDEQEEPPSANPRQDPLRLRRLRRHPREHLREFGWPDPHQLSSDLWHWLEQYPSPESPWGARPGHLDALADTEILESLARIDGGFVQRLYGSGPELTQGLGGSYWKILLTHLTRSSPDLVDTLFQRLTRRHEPSVAHRFFAFLTPVLRLRLFLTINFDTLLEDALRMEGFRPTVYEVADGLSLPHQKLIHEGISVVKLHGGAYGLLVGDKLDTPLDEETRSRFRAYLPDHLILLVMGVGAWDQRILDLVELARERDGDVLWLRFEREEPAPLAERFGEPVAREWLKTLRILDPGAFLRELYTQFKRSHPSSSCPYPVTALRPVPAADDRPRSRGERRPDDTPEQRVHRGDYLGLDGRLFVAVDEEDDYSLGASLRLAKFVAGRSETHRPVWIDLESQYTVEGVLVQVIRQLRRYDPGLPPEIMVIERAVPSDRQGGDRAADSGPYSKVIRRLYSALARGRYVLAFNGVNSFSRPPLSHHRPAGEADWPPRDEAEHQAEDLRAFLHELLLLAEPGGDPRRVLGLLDSVLAFAVDFPEASSRSRVLKDRGATEALLKSSLAEGRWKPGTALRQRPDEGPRALDEDLRPEARRMPDPVLLLVASFRRRRDLPALARLLPKYLDAELRSALESLSGPGTTIAFRDWLPNEGLQKADPAHDAAKDANGPPELSGEAVDQVMERLLAEGYLYYLEGGELWMSRKLRNAIHDRAHELTEKPETAGTEPCIAATALLASLHRDLAAFQHRDLYVGSQDVSALLEEIYHRVATLRYSSRLAELTGTSCTASRSLAVVLEKLIRPCSAEPRQLAVEPAARVEEDVWAGQPRLRGSSLDPGSLVQWRFRQLRALRELLAQERDSILSRVPSQVLGQWLEHLRCSVDSLTAADHDWIRPRWRHHLHAERLRLIDLLDDLKVEALLDLMHPAQLLGEGSPSLLRIEGLGRSGEAATQGPTLAELLRELPARSEELAFQGKAAPRAELEKQLGSLPAVKGRFKTSRAVRALATLSLALRRSGWWDLSKESDALWLARQADRLLSSTLRRGHDSEPDQPLDGPVPKELLELRLVLLRLHCDLSLWGVSPWDLKGQPVTASLHQQKVTETVLSTTEQALRILDDIHEEGRTDRAHFYSLRGRAHYLCGQFEQAYREFDLARAGLTEASAAEREALAVALLRQVECLMVHSDDTINRWVNDQFEAELEPGCAERWLAVLSSEGHRKLRLRSRSTPPEAGEITALCRLSMANVSPAVLFAFQGRVGTSPRLTEGLLDTLGTLRARLAAAGELLDRVEHLLEQCRRKVEWWACLFQLRAQLAVESLLLLATGDVEPLLPAAASMPSFLEMPLTGNEAWKKLKAWLAAEGQPPAADLRAALYSPPHDQGSSVLLRDRWIHRRFINSFMRSLRTGLVAVRQGLDILLPADAHRLEPLLQHNVQINRFLRLWTELMVCGAFLTTMSQRQRPDRVRDDSVREPKDRAQNEQLWQQWLYLNRLAGFSRLTRCPEVSRWFHERSWTMDGPGLSARARILARMDLCLIGPAQLLPGPGILEAIELPGANALEPLRKELCRREEGSPTASPR